MTINVMVIFTQQETTDIYLQLPCNDSGCTKHLAKKGNYSICFLCVIHDTSYENKTASDRLTFVDNLDMQYTLLTVSRNQNSIRQTSNNTDFISAHPMFTITPGARQ